MGKAARAIIIQGNQLLVMYRDKHGSQYYTLVGGRANTDESIEKTLIREVKEETGLEVINYQLVFVEDHPAPYNQQYIFLCEVSSTEAVEIQSTSEEALMNRIGINNHTPTWVNISIFSKLPFRTPQLQSAIDEALSKGFPKQPVNL
jgi:ADP-ribose pyrophosphatase YjhB (NUDIX family)